MLIWSPWEEKEENRLGRLSWSLSRKGSGGLVGYEDGGI